MASRPHLVPQVESLLTTSWGDQWTDVQESLHHCKLPEGHDERQEGGYLRRMLLRPVILNGCCTCQFHVDAQTEVPLQELEGDIAQGPASHPGAGMPRDPPSHVSEHLHCVFHCVIQRSPHRK